MKYYEFMIKGNASSIVDAMRYMQILCACISQDDDDAYWRKDIYDDGIFYSLATSSRREINAIVSCLRELSSDEPDLLVSYIEKVCKITCDTQLFQLHRGKTKRLGYWPQSTVGTIYEAISLANLSKGNPCFDDFATAISSIQESARTENPILISACNVFAYCIVEACSKNKIRRQRRMMFKLAERLSEIEGILRNMYYIKVAPAFCELLSLYESMVLEYDSKRPNTPIQPQTQTSSIRI